MAHINDYSKDAIARRTGKDVVSWYTIEKSYGVTEVHYELKNRHAGMCNGGAIGGFIGVASTAGLVVATVVNPAFAPLLAINATGGSLGSILAGMGIGHAVGRKDSHWKCFLTRTGEFIGDTATDITKTARSKGEQSLRESQFAHAKQWFNIAYASGDKDALKAMEEVELAEKSYNNDCLEEMNEHFHRACELAPAGLRGSFEEGWKHFKALPNETRAARLFEEAMETWNRAWKKEEEGKTQQAADLLQSAQRKCQRAAEMCEANEEFQKWAHVISLKIDGDSLFNEGYSWQDRANQSYSQELYEDALGYYKLALEKYTEGLRTSGDQRFQDCVDIVQNQIGVTRQAIDHIRAVSMTTSVQRDQTFVMHA